MDHIDTLIDTCKANIRALEQFNEVMIQNKEAFDDEDAARVNDVWQAEQATLQQYERQQKKIENNNDELQRVITTRETCFNTHGNALFSAYPNLLRFFVDKQRSLKALLE